MKSKDMKKGELQLNKWCFKFGIIPIYWRKNGYMFHLGVFKLISTPKEGYMITKENYKGFWLRKEFLLRGFEINL